ncbi:MAG: gamma-glutamylcyclotransferase [Deltaproteobacteria bacterium]
MSTDFTFAYGANMNPSILRSWLESNGYDSSLVINRWPAVIDGYDYVWNYYSSFYGGGVANLEPREKSSVPGLLIEFEESLLKAFDRREGHPTFFSRGQDRVPVMRCEDNEVLFAWLYLGSPNRGDRRDVWPTRAYKKIIFDAAEELEKTQV